VPAGSPCGRTTGTSLRLPGSTARLQNTCAACIMHAWRYKSRSETYLKRFATSCLLARLFRVSRCRSSCAASSSDWRHARRSTHGSTKSAREKTQRKLACLPRKSCAIVTRIDVERRRRRIRSGRSAARHRPKRSLGRRTAQSWTTLWTRIGCGRDDEYPASLGTSEARYNARSKLRASRSPAAQH